MSNVNLYRVHPETKALQSVREVNFSDHNFRERYDIQEWVEAVPSVLGERLLIVAKEKTYFEGTNERPDLVGIDSAGNIVIIELKRDDSGVDVHWQAIKYASYWARFSINDVLAVYTDYLSRQGDIGDASEVDVEYAKQNIVDFVDDKSIEHINQRQRIVLVSHRFAKEAITAVDWLLENYGLDIKCVQLIPYFDEDKGLYYLQSNVVLPLPGIDDYLVKPSAGKAAATKATRGSRNDDSVTKFFEQVRDELLASDVLPEPAKPTRASRWAGSDHRFRYYHFWYEGGLWDNWHLSYRVWLYNGLEKNGGNANKAVVFLSVNTKYLLENGVTEKEVLKIREALRTACTAANGLQFRDDNAAAVVNTAIPYKELNSSLKASLNDKLVSLIGATFEIVRIGLALVDENVEQQREPDA